MNIRPEAFRVFSQLMCQLHRCIMDGHEDTEAAEEIRCRLDGVWYRMTPDEQTLGRGLCEDLYLISENVKHGSASDE